MARPSSYTGFLARYKRRDGKRRRAWDSASAGQAANSLVIQHNYWGEPERAPHSRDLHIPSLFHVRPTVGTTLYVGRASIR